jgi:hypothetical protein
MLYDRSILPEGWSRVRNASRETRKRVTHFVEMRREDGRFFEVIFRRQLERILARRRTLVKD